MRIYRGLPALADGPVALTIGNFDGVHTGHQEMLRRVVDRARELDVPSVVLTFDPHPMRILHPQRAPGLIIYTHTEVPDALEGRGIGSKLARTVLDYARAAHLAVVPSCPFIRAYIARHPEYQDLVRR